MLLSFVTSHHKNCTKSERTEKEKQRNGKKTNKQTHRRIQPTQKRWKVHNRNMKHTALEKVENVNGRWMFTFMQLWFAVQAKFNIYPIRIVCIYDVYMDGKSRWVCNVRGSVIQARASYTNGYQSESDTNTHGYTIHQ